ncbi:MAG: hypothetical protein EVA37_00925 [Flavobacteriales bacterium]|nr:MAG: hypothetical protein EVA37_00925 [Flavobacteriales bacterium]
MADSQISKTNIIKNNLKYFLQSFVIILSIFISFFFEDVRKNKEDILTKNDLVSDLIISLDEDLIQIDNLLKILQDSEKNILEILNDIDLNHKNLTDLEAIKTILDIEVGISFFPKDGIFEQLISTGTFELIKNNELKKLLLEMFNHQKDRNYATSTEIDQWNISKRGEILKKFRVRFSYNSYDGEFYGSRTVNTFDFNRDYYMSSDFYGLLSQAQYYSNMYMRLLSDIKKSYETAKSLSVEELKKS